MPVVWPSGIAGEMFDGLTDSLQDTRVRTQMDAGPPKMRRRFTAPMRTLTIPFRMTGAERDTFDTFFQTTLVQGTLTFDWEEPLNDATVSYQFVSVPIFALSVGNSDPDKRLWDTVLKLEVLP